MLYLTINEQELYDESKNIFYKTKKYNIALEHSLVSLSKWESKYKKPFINSEKKHHEILDYIIMMTITQNIPSYIYNALSESDFKKITNYIQDPMTATTIAKSNGSNNEIVTAEVLYYYMIRFNIPFECQKWHLNRLLTLINVCAAKENPVKRSHSDFIAERNRLNQDRLRKLNTKG